MLYALAFSSDSRLLAISEGHTVRVKEIASGKEVFRRKKHAARPGLPAQADVTALAILPKDRVLATGLMDGTTLLWALAPVPAKPTVFNAQTLEGVWSDLAGDDAGKAYRAIYAAGASEGNHSPARLRRRNSASRPEILFAHSIPACYNCFDLRLMRGLFARMGSRARACRFAAIPKRGVPRR
jgi:hypothetical protein